MGAEIAPWRRDRRQLQATTSSRKHAGRPSLIGIGRYEIGVLVNPIDAIDNQMQRDVYAGLLFPFYRPCIAAAMTLDSFVDGVSEDEGTALPLWG
jgi:hypothetical protein